MTDRLESCNLREGLVGSAAVAAAVAVAIGRTILFGSLLRVLFCSFIAKYKVNGYTMESGVEQTIGDVVTSWLLGHTSTA